MRRLLLIIGLAVSLFASPAYAQFGLLGAARSITITMTPAHPGPHTAVHLTAQSSVFDLERSSLIWSTDGSVLAQGVGVTEIDVTAQDLGSKTTVSVEVTAPDVVPATATVHIIPTQVDLLFDTDAYTPPFYRGHDLPSAGTTLILQALPHFVLPGGSELRSGDLTYTWRRNGQVMGSVSGRGKSAIVVPSPVLYAHDVLSVEVESSDGSMSGEASMTIAAEDPTLVLYEDNPIFGVLYGFAFGPTAFVAKAETTLTAIPYFASARTLKDPLLDYVWRVNGVRVTTDPSVPNELTLQASDSSAVARIQLAVTHATNFFLNASRTWNITFSTKGSAQDLFRATLQP